MSISLSLLNLPLHSATLKLEINLVINHNLSPARCAGVRFRLIVEREKMLVKWDARRSGVNIIVTVEMLVSMYCM